METIRWGIIGCGDVTEVKSGPGFQKARNSTLIAVMRRSAGKAEDYARRHNVPHWYDNAQDLIHDPEVDAVYIATPPSEHRNYSIMCAEAGKPVYVEKPMARTFAECQEMIQACNEAKVPLFVAYYRRALPKFLKIKELIDNGAIGNPRLVTMVLYKSPYPADLNPEAFPWRVIPKFSGGGYFFDLAPHTLDIIDYVLGPVEQAAGFASNQAGLYPAEDIVSCCLTFRNNIQGSGLWCFTASFESDRNEIVGDKGLITFSTFGNDPVVLETKQGEKKFPFRRPPHIQQPFIQTMVDELNGEGKCPGNPESAARTNWVMDKILEDWRREKRILF